MKPEITQASALRSKVLSVVVAILAGVGVWCFWPRGVYSRPRVHPSIRNLQEPYQSVSTDFYLDGGSVGIRIVDRDNRIVELALPVFFDSPQPPRYDRLFVGSFAHRGTGDLEVLNPQDTKWMLADIVDRYVPSGIQHDAAVIALRGAPKEYVGAYIRTALRK